MFTKNVVKGTDLSLLKVKENDTCRKDEKTTTSCKPTNPEGDINEGFLCTKLAEVKGHIS